MQRQAASVGLLGRGVGLMGFRSPAVLLVIRPDRGPSLALCRAHAAQLRCKRADAASHATFVCRRVSPAPQTLVCA